MEKEKISKEEMDIELLTRIIDYLETEGRKYITGYEVHQFCEGMGCLHKSTLSASVRRMENRAWVRCPSVTKDFRLRHYWPLIPGLMAVEEYRGTEKRRINLRIIQAGYLDVTRKDLRGPERKPIFEPDSRDISIDDIIGVPEEGIRNFVAYERTEGTQEENEDGQD
jgi:hypothetical protein